LRAYNKALTFDSKDPDIWNNKCYILNKLGNYDEAVLAGNEGVNLSPQDPEIWDNLCDAYTGCNNRVKADECQKNVVSLKKSSSFFNEDTRGDRGGDTYWHETNSATHFVFIIIFIFSFISNIIRGNFGGAILAPIGALVAYYWWGPWMVDFAIEHNRNINWAYFYGMSFGLFGIFFYYVYVKVTRDPINKKHESFSRKSRLFWLPAVLLVLIIAAVIAAFVFGMTGNISKTKVVNVTVQQPDSNHITVTYLGGQDSDIMKQLTATVTDSSGNAQTKTIGQSEQTTLLPIGSSITFTGEFSGKKHVVAVATFFDGTQEIFDNYIISTTVVSTYIVPAKTYETITISPRTK